VAVVRGKLPEEVSTGLSFTSKDTGKEEIALIRQQMDVYQQNNDQDATKMYEFSSYAPDWDALHLDVSEWKALAPRFLSVLKAVWVAEIKQDGTVGSSTLVLDEPTMIRRCGFRIKDPSRFASEAKSPGWQTRSSNIINLIHVRGDATAAVAAGEVWVVANHSIKDVEALRAQPENELCKVLGDAANFVGKPVYAVYVLGNNVAQMVVEGKSKKMKA